VIAASRTVAVRRDARVHLSPVDLLLSAAIACWSVAVIANFLDLVTLSFSSRELDALLVAPAVALALLCVVSVRPASATLRLLTGWSAVLAAVLLLTPLVLASPTLAFGLPGVIAVAWLVSARPALGATAVIALTASFGSISIYLGWPYKRMIALLLAGMWLAAIARWATRRRTEPFDLPLGVMLVLGYLVISIAGVILATDPHVALGGFELAPWFMTTVLVVGYSQWSRQTQLRIVRWLLVTAVLVGAYATLRQIIGPSAKEQAAASISAYNFVNGKQKLIGSFLNGADLAEWSALMIPFCLSCVLGMRDRFRWVACLALPLLAVGLFGSQVRAAAVAVGIAALVVALLHGGARAFSGAKIGQTAIAVLIVALVILGAYAFAGSSSASSGHSYLALLTGSATDTSVSDHEYKWTVAFRDLSGHPFGYGLGTAPAGYTANAPSTPYILPVSGFSVDNGFLKVALEQGFVVMILFAAAIALLAAGLARGGLTSTDPLRATIALGAAGTAISLFVLEGAGAFADGTPVIAGWIVIGLGVAQLAHIRAERRSR
jgi:hypothetical protein